MNLTSVLYAKKSLQELLDVRKDEFKKLDHESISSLVKPAMVVLEDLETFLNQADFTELILRILEE